MNKFGAKLMTEIVQPILGRRIVDFEIYDDQEHFLEIKFDAPKSGSPDPLNVLDYLTKLFR